MSTNSNWISFLRQYGPIPTNDNMYDEAIQRNAKKKKITPIRIDSEHLEEIVENLKSDKPNSVILTGTAGDGKTYYCREIWEALGGTKEDWIGGEPIQSLTVGTRKLIIVKDLSEIDDQEKRDVMEGLVEVALSDDRNRLFLIAANDGQLVDAWKLLDDTGNIQKVRECIEDLLVDDEKSNSDVSIYLYNLSRVSAAKSFPKILQSVLEHPGWNECSNCSYREADDIQKRCPIWENRRRLEDEGVGSITRKRLTSLLVLSEKNGMHLPMRQLLLLVANIILGHPSAKDRLLNCREVQKVIEQGTAFEANLYRNIFGENLSPRKRENTSVFGVLGAFGIGTETSNHIDNLLIFGNDDPELRAFYEETVESDSFYGADKRYARMQRDYLEGEQSNEDITFLGLLRTQRQRLFFTIEEKYEEEIKLWEMTSYHYAGEFLKMCKSLKEEDKVDRNTQTKVIRGLNRIFNGLLSKDHERLALATSGSYTQAKVSRIFEEFISVPKKKGEFVRILLNNNSHPLLEVSISKGGEYLTRLQLKLMKYEFICRVSDGALPGSFSRECYEDLLAFKSQILSKLTDRRNEDNEEDESNIQFIFLNAEGSLDSQSVEVNS